MKRLVIVALVGFGAATIAAGTYTAIETRDRLVEERALLESSEEADARSSISGTAAEPEATVSSPSIEEQDSVSEEFDALRGADHPASRAAGDTAPPSGQDRNETSGAQTSGDDGGDPGPVAGSVDAGEAPPDAPRTSDPDEIASAGGQSLPAGATGSSGSAVDFPEDSAAVRRLASIFGAMQAREAASVLALLDDAEIESLLFHLTDRKAARILGQIEPRRAAKLSRAVLASGERESP